MHIQVLNNNSLGPMVGVVFGKTLVRFANPNLGYDL